MKSLFRSRLLLLTTCILLFWKGISIIIWFLLDTRMSGIGVLFPSTGFSLNLWLMLAAGLSGNRAFCIVMLTIVGLAFLTFWVFFVLLAINRSGAGPASVGLMVLCVLDLPITIGISASQWWSILVCIVFHAAIFIAIALLRRSRPGIPEQLDKMPNSI